MITPYVRHEGDFFTTLFEGFFKESEPFSRENNILPPYARTIFKKLTPLEERTSLFDGFYRSYCYNQKIFIIFTKISPYYY
jgi:hypothetical protein